MQRALHESKRLADSWLCSRRTRAWDRSENSQFASGTVKTSGLGIAAAAVALPRLALSGINAVARSKRSPLNPYYRYMARKGIQHGSSGADYTFMPRARRALTAALGPITGVNDYELGLHAGRTMLQTAKQHSEGAHDVRAAMRAMQQVTDTADDTYRSPLLRNFHAGAADFARNADYGMSRMEKMFLSNRKPYQQGRTTTLLGALRGGMSEAVLTPHAPLSGFARGAIVGGAEFLPDAALLSAAAKGNMASAMGLKSRLTQSGMTQQQSPTRLRGFMHHAVGAFDPNFREYVAIGKDLASHQPQFRRPSDLMRNSITANLKEEVGHFANMPIRSLVPDFLQRNSR